MGPRPQQHQRVFAVGHFPPPVHGMAVATIAFTQLLSDHAEVESYDISGVGHGRSGLHHGRRLARTLRAVAAIVVHGDRGDSLYLGSDAGPGMLYTAVVVAAARCRGLRRYLHHHSYAYIARRSTLMALVHFLAGREATHVFTCGRQAAAFAGRYCSRARTAVLPIEFSLVETDGARAVPRPAAQRTAAEGPLVLGHLSNLSLEKGLSLVFDTLAVGVAAGLSLELVLAGPVPDAQAEEVLRAGLARGGDRVRYLGPVHGSAKDAFFAGIDVFLFPTRYRHESFGIVVAEAMASGVPSSPTRRAAWTRGGWAVAAWCSTRGKTSWLERSISSPPGAGTSAVAWRRRGTAAELVAQHRQRAWLAAQSLAAEIAGPASPVGPTAAAGR